MKKILSILLSTVILLTAAGCTEPPAVTTDPTDSFPTTLPTETTVQLPVPLNMPLLSLSTPVITEEHRAEDGTVVFTYDYQSVALTLDDPQIADAIVIDLLNLTDFENSAAQSLLAEAKSAYTNQADWVPYGFSTFFAPRRFDQGILSLYGVQHIQSGAGRSSSAAFSVTYDLLSGRRLTLTDILLKSYSADTLTQLISDALQGFAEKGMLYSDYAYVISDLFTTNKPSDNWFFSEKGLCFYFAPYEIAPYSTGTVIAEVPYSDLTALLRPEYFPAELVVSSGILCHLPFDGTDLSGFTQFTELILDDKGSKHILYPDGVLQNVQIISGTWKQDGSFQPETTLFAAFSLSSGDAIVLQLPQALPYGLQLSYLSDGHTVFVDLQSLINKS